METEKKEYIAPSMDILSMSNEISLLSGSGVDVDIIDASDYNDEFN